MYRETDKLTPNFQKKVEALLEEVGDRVMITESYRSPERQKELYAQGRTKPGQKVTWTLHSRHMDGEAVDLAFKDGSEVYWPAAGGQEWQELADKAKKYGIMWPYRDKGWGIDSPHFEDNGEPFNLEPMFDADKVAQDWGEEAVKALKWYRENDITDVKSEDDLRSAIRAYKTRLAILKEVANRIWA